MNLGLLRDRHPDENRVDRNPAPMQLLVVCQDPVRVNHLAGTEARCSAANELPAAAASIHSIEMANSRWCVIGPRGSRFRQGRR